MWIGTTFEAQTVSLDDIPREAGSKYPDEDDLEWPAASRRRTDSYTSASATGHIACAPLLAKNGPE